MQSFVPDIYPGSLRVFFNLIFLLNISQAFISLVLNQIPENLHFVLFWKKKRFLSSTLV